MGYLLWNDNWILFNMFYMFSASLNKIIWLGQSGVLLLQEMAILTMWLAPWILWSTRPFWQRVWCLQHVNWSLDFPARQWSQAYIQVYQNMFQGSGTECPWVAVSASRFKSHWKSLMGFETSGGSTGSTKCQWAGSFSHEQWAKSPIERCQDPLNTCQKHLFGGYKG